MVGAGVVAGSEAAQADFRIAAGILRDCEEIVARNVEAYVLKPAVEAVAEGVAERKGGELEVGAVLEERCEG